MLLPCNLSYGCGRRITGVTISNQYLDYILAYIVRYDSLFSLGFSRIHLALNKHLEGYISEGKVCSEFKEC